MNPVVSLAVVTSLFLTVASLERIRRLQFRPSPLFRCYLATDGAWYAVATAANVVAIFLVLPRLSALRIDAVGRLLAEVPTIARLALAVVLYDFVSFVIHVGLHRSDALWSFHKVHHSSVQLDWLATTRAHMAENLLRQVGAQLPLLIIGMPAPTVAATLVIYAAFALVGHSNLRLGSAGIEALFVTPRLHRLHHVPSLSQSNFGTIFSIWDRALGRLVSEDVGPEVATGVPGEVDSYPQRFRPALRQPFVELKTRREVARV